MRLNFNEVKTTQAGAYLVKKRGQGYMSYMKLIKLLYLADREALVRWGRPITFDRFSAMPHGMVLSGTLDLINGEGAGGAWATVFKAVGDHEISLTQDPNIDELSNVEIKLLDEIFSKYGRLSRWEIADFTHTLPEWTDPEGSSIPVEITDILKFAKKTPAEIEAIKKELESISVASHLFTHK